MFDKAFPRAKACLCIPQRTQRQPAAKINRHLPVIRVGDTLLGSNLFETPITKVSGAEKGIEFFDIAVTKSPERRESNTIIYPVD